MKNKIKQHTELNKYSKLQMYDYTEFNGIKYQAIKTNFNKKNFRYIRFKSAKYTQCIFKNCTFYCSGLSEAHFLSSELYNFSITDCNMQFCDFSNNCVLEGLDSISLVSSSNLSQSLFHNLQIKNVKFKSTTISQASFINTTFQNVQWESCTLQDNLFNNGIMENISLIGCNLEYSEFRNIKFINAKLPFHQIPYIFGLLDYLKDYPNDISLGSVSSNKTINAKEYICLLPDLFSYYINMNEYFPAINIALFNNDYQRANELIEVALKYYIQSNDFRKLKSICKLIANHSFFDKHFLTQLYFKIIEYYNIVSISEYEKYQYALHINEIKKILTDSNDTMPKAHLYIKTNITSNDTEKIGIFCKIIEECMEKNNISNEDYSVEIRHNSAPISFWLTLTQQNTDMIINAIGMFMAVITADPQFLQTALNVVANIATIGSFIMQIEEKYKPKKKTVTSTYENVTAEDIKYIKQTNEILENKQISIEIALPFFNFSYHKERLHQSQN